MTKLSRKPVDPEKLGYYINNLWAAFTLMDSKEDIRVLFKDLFTHTEYKMFAKRLEIARQLLRLETYESIQKNLNVTSRTINNISNILSERGVGLRKADAKLGQLEEKYLKKQKTRTNNLANPFLKKAKDNQKTVLGTLLKAGAVELDKTISRKLKQRTAKK